MNHVTSPRTDDQGIEHLIQAKGKVAPRVTPQDIEDCIVACYYFTAADGIYGEEVINQRPSCTPEVSTTLLTFCILVMRNGFTVSGTSACASAENFDAEIGKRVAREDAKQKIWPLLGYALRTQLHESNQ